MRITLCRSLRTLPLLALTAFPVYGQANANPAIDVELGALKELTMMGRTGSFPNGQNGISMTTTSCNKGTVTVPWERAMDPDHPFIAFIVARDDGVQFKQISNRSHVKHGFFALQQSLCDTCQGGDPQGQFLGIGCSDTYSKMTNGNRVWLGPADEIDPWTGIWDPICSYFDEGDPAVSGAGACDGVKTLQSNQTNQFDGVKNRVEIKDADLLDSGVERFYYQAQYVVAQELESKRGNNVGWREVQPNWTGSVWNMTDQSPLALGSVLDGWNGASVSSNTNGADDGRVYIGVKVTGPVDGIYHYEYAIHNRDNSRGFSKFTLPICAESQITNVTFTDIDRETSNDWTIAASATELTWSTTVNPLAWNTIYNFAFDSDAAPIDGVGIDLEQFAAGAGAASVTVSTRVPTGLFNYEIGPGCSFATAPRLFGAGTPAQATLGNNSFQAQAVNLAPATLNVFFFSPFSDMVNLGSGCSLYLSSQALIFRLRTSDALGMATLNLPIPNDMTLQGIDLNMQLFEFDPLGGPYASDYDLSNGLLIRVGDMLPSCP